MKKIYTMLLLSLLFFLLAGARLTPVFFSSAEDKVKIAYDVEGQKSKEAKEETEVNEGEMKGEDLMAFYSCLSLFPLKVSTFSPAAFRINIGPCLPYQILPPDCCWL